MPQKFSWKICESPISCSCNCWFLSSRIRCWNPRYSRGFVRKFQKFFAFTRNSFYSRVNPWLKFQRKILFLISNHRQGITCSRVWIPETEGMHKDRAMTWPRWCFPGQKAGRGKGGLTRLLAIAKTGDQTEKSLQVDAECTDRHSDCLSRAKNSFKGFSCETKLADNSETGQWRIRQTIRLLGTSLWIVPDTWQELQKKIGATMSKKENRANCWALNSFAQINIDNKQLRNPL